MTPDRFGELRSILANPPTAENIKALRTLISSASAEAAPTGIFKHLDRWCMSSPMFNYLVHHFAHSSEWRRAYPWAIGTRPSDIKTARVILTEHDLHSGSQKYSAVFGECILGASESYRGVDRAGFATSLLGAEVGQVWQGVYSARGADELLWAHTAPLILAMDPQAAGLVQIISGEIAACADVKGGRPRGELAESSWVVVQVGLDEYEEMKVIGRGISSPRTVDDLMPPVPDGWWAPMMRSLAARAGSIHGLILAAWYKGQLASPVMHAAMRSMNIPFDSLNIVTQKSFLLYGDAAIADIHDAIGTIWVHHWQDRLAA